MTPPALSVAALRCRPGANPMSEQATAATGQDYNDAAKKAFIMNRIGDLGLVLGIILIFINFNSIAYADVFAQAESFQQGDQLLTIITILLFIGAMGKSAQLPLYTWLPDAS